MGCFPIYFKLSVCFYYLSLIFIIVSVLWWTHWRGITGVACEKIHRRDFKFMRSLFFSLPVSKHQGKAMQGHNEKTRRAPSPDTKSTIMLILDFLFPRTVKNKTYFIGHSVYCICFSSPN